MFAWRKDVPIATGNGRRLTFWFGAVLCIAATFVAPTVARADLNTNYAPGADTRNFGDSDGGWTGAEDYSGLCIAGVTCVDVDDTFVATGGVAGAGDGFIRTSEGGLLSLGIAATSTGVWSSPQFTYSGADGTAPEKLSFRIVRRSDIDDFLDVLGASATYRIDLIDHSGGTNVNLSPTQTLAGPNDWTPIALIDVDPSDLTLGHDYSIRITNEFEAPVAALPGGHVDYDNVRLRAHTDTPPLNTSIAGPKGTIRNPTPTYTFSSPDPAATFECSLDDAPFTACESPYTTEPLDHGRHDLRVRAVDAGGKVDRTPAKRAVWVAVSTRISGPGGTINDRTPTYRFNSPDAGATFECSFDDGPFTACESPYTTDPLSNGRHKLLVRAVVDGKVDTTPARRGIWIPKSAPPA